MFTGKPHLRGGFRIEGTSANARDRLVVTRNQPTAKLSLGSRKTPINDGRNVSAYMISRLFAKLPLENGQGCGNTECDKERKGERGN